MAEGVNEVRLLGNVGADPELRATGGGQSVLSIRMATTEVYFDANHVKQEKTEWHRVVVWGARSQGLSRLLTKGDTIYVSGSLSTRQFEDREGNKRSTTEVKAYKVVLIPTNRGGGRRRPARDDEDDGDGEGFRPDEPEGRSFFG